MKLLRDISVSAAISLVVVVAVMLAVHAYHEWTAPNPVASGVEKIKDRIAPQHGVPDRIPVPPEPDDPPPPPEKSEVVPVECPPAIFQKSAPPRLKAEFMRELGFLAVMTAAEVVELRHLVNRIVVPDCLDMVHRVITDAYTGRQKTETQAHG